MTKTYEKVREELYELQYQVHCLLEGITKDDDIFEKLRADIRDVASGWDFSFISIGNGDYYPTHKL